MAQFEALLKPLTIKNLTIRNRVMSTSHAPAYADAGMPGERYQLYHLEKAKGGIGLTMFGGSASVAPDSSAEAFGQISVSEDRVIPFFQEFSRRVHDEGAALMCQITHMGKRNRWDTADWLPLVAPTQMREPAHRAFAKEIEDFDIERIIKAFGEAAARCKEGGLDGVEMMFDASHLVEQFLTPSNNLRDDEWGGSLENRERFGHLVLQEVRRAVGDDFIISLRVTGDSLLDGGLTQEEMIGVLKRYADSGLVDVMNVMHGNTETHHALAVMIPNMAYPPAAFLYLPSAVKQACDVTVFHAGRIADLATADRAVAEGHVDMIAMTRAHMADPHLMKKLSEDRVDDVRQCVGANYCIDRIYVGGDALCIQNPSTGREQSLPHVLPRAQGKRRIVVAGGGVAGMEAARAAAERGHDVVLYEKADRLGGQVNLAARAVWRENLSGITRWLAQQVEKKSIEVRLNTAATREAVEADEPDLVVVATGGRPNKGLFGGNDLAVSAWDVLSGAVEPGENVLLHDDNGQHQGPSVAQFMATRGSQVELATPDRMVAEEMGSTNFSVHLAEMYRLGIVMSPNLRLTGIRRDGNKLRATLRNPFSLQDEERLVDQVVGEHGTLPVDDLYFALKPHSSNLGEVDLDALIEGRAQAIINNPDGRFQLFRIGDCVAGRNIHAALYDARRLMRDA